MALSRVKTWIAGEVLTASDLNAEFNNLLNNSRDLVSPLTGVLDMNGFELIMDADADSSLTADTNNRLDVRLGGVDLFVLDGTAASLVNGLTFTAAVTGSGASVASTGSDTNIPVTLKGKGTGAVILGQATSTDVRLAADQPIADSSGNELLKFAKTATAVNEVTVTNAATGTAPIIAATGGDTNIALSVSAKGTGAVIIGHTVAITDDGLQQVSDGTVNGISSSRFSADANGTFIRLIKSRHATKGSQTVVQSGDGLGTIQWFGSDGTNAELGAAISAAIDATPGDNDMPGRLVFSTTADGANTLTERMRIDSAGLVTLAQGQIAFPAAQNASAGANTLDDYEEGTFTPTLGGSTTYTTQTGIYTKFGRVVEVRIRITVILIGTGSVSTISGLPFANAALIAAAPCAGFASIASSVAYIVGQISASASTIVMAGTTAAVGTISSPLTIFQNSADLLLSGTYGV